MVFETIAKLLADRLDCEVSEIKAEDTFHDLGIDSLDTVDLLMNLEDELGLSIELDEKVETVGQLVELVEKNQQEQTVKEMLIGECKLSDCNIREVQPN